MEVEIETIPLIYKLDTLLIELLASLQEEEWEAPTVAKFWRVKDVAAHLLDGNLRGLSTSRDHYFGEKAEKIQTYEDLVHFINQMNHSWVTASRRISPKILINLLEITGKQYTDHLASLNPRDEAVFSVAWAGQSTSPNWFHIAREYTEKFLHQQQIREATGRQKIMTREFFFPFLETLMRAFPYTFRKTLASKGTKVGIEISSEIGGMWVVELQEKWKLIPVDSSPLDAKVTIPPQVAWKLFSKSLRPEEVRNQVRMEGDPGLGYQALHLLGFMA